ncbi:MAG TPA: C39 family peptidase [Candidatus Bathyarchaeia archaeon]|nr:C39 family peptidase [Candidatus Bathyarchaeia archaeon]
MSKLKIFVVIFVVVGLSLGIYKSDLISKAAKEEAGKKTGTFISENEKFSAPSSYHMENVPYYGEKNWCWGSSALMLLMGAGLTEEKIQNARAVIKNEGRGGPPDMFIGFQEYDLVDNVRIAYSKDYVEKYADFYNNQLLVNPGKQTILFDNQNEAFNYLKSLISSDVLVMIVVHNGNHFVIATGYDEDYIYTNDPGWDNGYDYKIDSGPDLEQRRIAMDDFLKEWSISGQEEEIGGKIGFPGDYGIIWLAE